MRGLLVVVIVVMGVAFVLLRLDDPTLAWPLRIAALAVIIVATWLYNRSRGPGAEPKTLLESEDMPSLSLTESAMRGNDQEPPARG